MSELVASLALSRATANVGNRINPQGMCLNFVWRMYGAVPSVGAAVGKLDTAWNAWSAVQTKHVGDRNVPAGYFAMLGPSPTRTDRNKYAGDIILSRGDGSFICTDAFGNIVGIMSLDARERQTQRPFVGWGEDLGGHPIVGKPGSTGPSTPLLTPQEEDTMYAIKVNGRDLFLIGQGFLHWHQRSAEADLARKVTSSTDELHNLTDSQAAMLAHSLGVPTKFLDTAYIAKHGVDNTWSDALVASGAIK